MGEGVKWERTQVGKGASWGRSQVGEGVQRWGRDVPRTEPAEVTSLGAGRGGGCRQDKGTSPESSQMRLSMLRATEEQQRGSKQVGPGQCSHLQRCGHTWQEGCHFWPCTL